MTPSQAKRYLALRDGSALNLPAGVMAAEHVVLHLLSAWLCRVIVKSGVSAG